MNGERIFKEHVTVKRDTAEDLMRAVQALVVSNGYYQKAQPIMDYFLPETYTKCELTNYRFDFRAVANPGGSEGIYIDCYLEGEYAEDMKNRKERIHIGTYKTLREDLEAMQIMGELCGSLTYYAGEYVNREIHRYTPMAELIREAERMQARADKEKEGEKDHE